MTGSSVTELDEALEGIQKSKNKTKLMFIFLSTSLLVCFFIALVSGVSSAGFKEAVGTMLSFIGLESPWALDETQRFIIMDVRLPRALLSITIGAALAIGGVAMQGLFRNPLAAPGILGINSGATLGAALFIVLGNFILPQSAQQFQVYAIPIGAFVCALIVTWIIVKVGTVEGRTNILILLLTGVAIQAILGSAMGFLIYLSDDSQLRTLAFWTLGDLGVAGWQELALILPVIILSSFMIIRKAAALNLLLLGESEAHHLGIDVQKLKKSLILWTALSISLAVAFTGMIGFIGLAAPHLVRILTGPGHKTLFPGAALMGALLLGFSDILSRSFTVAEIPVGVITAAIGAPVFFWLLLQQRKGASFD